jgi:hypothetical protein
MGGVAVPLFLVGNVGIILGLFHGSTTAGALWLMCVAVPAGLQGRRHKMEENRPQPFTGLTNAVARTFLEQRITIPRFVLAGDWSHALRAPAPSPAARAQP